MEQLRENLMNVDESSHGPNSAFFNLIQTYRDNGSQFILTDRPSQNYLNDSKEEEDTPVPLDQDGDIENY